MKVIFSTNCVWNIWKMQNAVMNLFTTTPTLSDLQSTLQIKELGQWINYSSDNEFSISVTASEVISSRSSRWISRNSFPSNGAELHVRKIRRVQMRIDARMHVHVREKTRGHDLRYATWRRRLFSRGIQSVAQISRRYSSPNVLHIWNVQDGSRRYGEYNMTNRSRKLSSKKEL